MGSLDLPVVLWGPRLDAFVHDGILRAERIQQARPIPRRRGILPLCQAFVGEFGPVVGLDHLRGVAEKLDRLPKADDGLVHGMLVREMEVPFPRRLIEEGVLVEPPLQSRGFARGRDELDVDLPFFSRGLRGVVFLVVPFLRIRFVRLVSIGLFENPEARRIGDGEAGFDGLRPNVDRAVVGVSLSVAGDFVFRPFAGRPRVRAVGAVALVLQRRGRPVVFLPPPPGAGPA